MKIRIKDNTVRLRLTQTEVSTLKETGEISSKTEFFDHTFYYILKISDEKNLSASFAEGKVLVKVPSQTVHNFCSSDEVGFEGESGKVKILVEKDFVCLDNSAEDQSDNYPNPNSVC